MLFTLFNHPFKLNLQTIKPVNENNSTFTAIALKYCTMESTVFMVHFQRFSVIRDAVSLFSFPSDSTAASKRA